MSKGRKLYVMNDPTTLRIVPELACEIGLNESIMLLQLDYIISIARNEHVGIWNERRGENKWCYFSIRNLQAQYFTFWSIATINRTIQSLINKELVIEDNFNKEKYDKTRWLALNFKGISRLRTIKVEENETNISQNKTRNETGRNQNETGSAQNETPIPETSSETSTDKTDNLLIKQQRNPIKHCKVEVIPEYSEPNLVIARKQVRNPSGLLRYNSQAITESILSENFCRTIPGFNNCQSEFCNIIRHEYELYIPPP
ncbi:MAG TPA: hypothetical protein DIW17_12595 [Clostridiales bacterium]|jgi:hypothetical protein|nr:hypothetical protein [Clostridiales bacterium]